jgi:hypothetical protein
VWAPIANGLGQRLDDPAGEQAGMAGLLPARLDHREFVAAEPGDQLVTAHRGAQPLRRRDQQGVAGGVAVLLVDRLEAGQVDAEHRDRFEGLGGLGDGLAETLGEDGAVGQAGQRVVEGEVGDPLRRFLALGNVAHREDPQLRPAPGERAKQQLDLAALAVGAKQPAFGRRRVRRRREGAEIDVDEQVGKALGRVADAVEAGEPEEAPVGVDDSFAVDHHQPLDRGVGEGAQPVRLLDRVAGELAVEQHRQEADGEDRRSRRRHGQGQELRVDDPERAQAASRQTVPAMSTRRRSCLPVIAL